MSPTPQPRGSQRSGLPSRPHRIAPHGQTSPYLADDLVLDLLLVLCLMIVANAFAVQGKFLATLHHDSVRAPIEIAGRGLPEKRADLNEP